MKTIDKNNLNGVFKLDCEQCNIKYMGVTGWKFSTWLKEHKTSQRIKDGKSVFRKHTNEEQRTKGGPKLPLVGYEWAYNATW